MSEQIVRLSPQTTKLALSRVMRTWGLKKKELENTGNGYTYYKGTILISHCDGQVAEKIISDLLSHQGVKMCIRK